jgi:ribosomal protein L21E
MELFRKGDKVRITVTIRSQDCPKGTIGTVEVVRTDGYMVKLHTGQGFDPVVWMRWDEVVKA